jgi:transcriptional regulator with XRE-family HTH domain
VTDGKALGAFLRWHRERVTPEDVGLPEQGRRRVPGLRRQEVARLAGISTEYYIRLEQGRERSPSVSVADALTEALRLDADQRAHLHELVRPRSRRTATTPEAGAPDGAVRLVDALAWPAMLLNRHMDVLAANPVARAVFPNMRPGVNRIRAVFLDPREREFWRDWDAAAADSVAQLRSDLGADSGNSPVRTIIAELEQRCPYFRALWSRQDVNQRALSPVHVRHPREGDLELHREKLLVAGADGIVMYVYYADAGTPSADRIARLTTAMC